MTFLSGRRCASAYIISAAFLVAAVAPSTAGATISRSDLLAQCEGSATDGHGSTFQAPILVKWTEEFNNASDTNIYACSGTQGPTKGTPKVTYLHTGSDAGSGACLKGYGAEVPEIEPTDFGTIGFCGTDEAPNETQHGEIEKRRKGGENNDLMTFPVAQGAVALLIHLPANCVAESETEKAGKFTKLGRLVLDDSTIEGIYAGTIKTWAAAIANETNNATVGKDKLTCIGGAEGISYEEGGVVTTLAPGEKATGLQEEEQLVTVVVRLDKSGTTHIFKSFLEQVNPSTPLEMEEYPETLVPATRGKGCTGHSFLEESLTWSQVAEGCQNQRWPTAAKVVFGTEKGNPGVVKRVNEDTSSIGYADLAVARDEPGLGQFDKKCETGHKEPECSGENKKGSATKVGERNHKFWAEVQDTATPSPEGYADPASNGDVEAPAQSNCKNTVYSNEAGKKFPPQSVREEWNQAKAELVQKATYAICGITYDLGLRQYKYYPGTSKEEATTVHDFLWWAVNAKAGGGQSFISKSDYEKLPSAILEEDEDGLEEMSWENSGLAK
jgi:ABC-type phosphate transport system substrate-binding protein